MAQTNRNTGGVVRFSLRTIGMIIGLVGAVLGLIVQLLYSTFHVLGRVAGVAADSSHFFGGIFLLLIGTVGAFMAPVLPIVSSVLLVIAGIGFFFAVGWWALIVSPFFLVAAVLVFSNQRVGVPGAE